MARDLPDNVVSMARLKGKVVETGQDVEINAPRRRKRKKGWRDHVSLLDVGLMMRLELSTLEYRVLFAMLGHVPEKGGCESHCTLAEIAADVGVLAPSVSRVVKDLRGRNLVRTIRQGKHEINPWIAYNGDFDSWNSEAEDWPEPTWVRGADAETGEIK